MRVGAYELESELGRGGMGRVLSARHLPTGALRAVKLLDAAADLETLERFRREAQVLARLGGDGVVRVHEVGVEGRTPWFAMDLMSGGSLAGRMKTQGRFPWAEAVALVKELARALGRCHALGLVHRDLKPANVLFDDQAKPRLADFGCVRDLGASRLTETGTVVGTPAYMAPEQLDGRRADTPADVYALGVILYELVTGSRPFADGHVHARLLAATAGRFEAPSRLAPVPAALDELVTRALAPDPRRRPPDGQALALELEALLAKGGAATAPPARSAGRWIAAIALLAAGAGAAALLARPKGTPADPERPRVPDSAAAVATREAAPPPTTRPSAADALARATEIARAVREDVKAIELLRGGATVDPPDLVPDTGALARALGAFPSEEREVVLAPITGLVRGYVRAWWSEHSGQVISKLSRKRTRRALEGLPSPGLEGSLLALEKGFEVCSGDLHAETRRCIELAGSLGAADPLLAATLCVRACDHRSKVPNCEETPGARSAELLDRAGELFAVAERQLAADDGPWLSGLRKSVDQLRSMFTKLDAARVERAEARARALWERVREVALAEDNPVAAPVTDDTAERVRELVSDCSWLGRAQRAAVQAPLLEGARKEARRYRELLGDRKNARARSQKKLVALLSLVPDRTPALAASMLALESPALDSRECSRDVHEKGVRRLAAAEAIASVDSVLGAALLVDGTAHRTRRSACDDPSRPSPQVHEGLLARAIDLTRGDADAADETWRRSIRFQALLDRSQLTSDARLAHALAREAWRLSRGSELPRNESLVAASAYLERFLIDDEPGDLDPEIQRSLANLPGELALAGALVARARGDEKEVTLCLEQARGWLEQMRESPLKTRARQLIERTEARVRR